jgi:hypothetical protein
MKLSQEKSLNRQISVARVERAMVVGSLMSLLIKGSNAEV